MKASTFAEWLRPLANILVLLSALLSLSYLTPEFARPFIPLPTFLVIKQVFPYVLCFAFMLFIPALRASRLPKFLKGLLLIVTPILFCASELGVFDRKSGISSTEILLNSVEAGRNRYNLVQIVPLGDPSSPCYLYQCDMHDMGCREISTYVGNCWSVEDSALVVNPRTGEVNVFIDDEWSNGLSMDFTYGIQPRSYIDRVRFESSDYYLAYFHDYDASGNRFTFMLYQCTANTVFCWRLPFQYETHGLPDGYLELDLQSREIRILIRNELIYSYGNSPKCHVPGCSLTEE